MCSAYRRTNSVDASFTDDQELLRKSAREFLAESSPQSLVAAVADGKDEEAADALWSKMAELGWMGLGIPEAYGGLGLGLTEVCILAEEMGRALAPAPWFSTVALAGECIAVAGNEPDKSRWLPEIAAGRLRSTLALIEEGGRMAPEGIAATAEPSGDGFVLSGTKALVPDAESCDLFIVAAQLRGEPGLFAIPRDLLEPVGGPSLDPVRPVSTIQLDGVRVGGDALLGGKPCGWPVVERALDRAASVLAAEMCGGSQEMLDRSVEFAKVRHQFGRPIGSFQGVSHRCADMLLQIEGARSLTYYAAWCCDNDVDQAPLAASAAKAAAADTYRSCTAQAIQVHGGIGFTWEAGLHHWYRRAFSSAALLGDVVFHRERVAKLLNL